MPRAAHTALHLAPAALLAALAVACGSSSPAEPPPGTVCSGPSDCTDPGLPVCVDQTCSQCDTREDCPVTAPLCDAYHSCYGCTKNSDCARFGDPTLAVCDLKTGGCRGCRANVECYSGLCSFDDSTCVDSDDILWVSQNGDDTGACTVNAPCATVQRAVDLAGGTRTWILVGPGKFDSPVIDTSLHLIGSGVEGSGSSTTLPGLLIQDGDVSVETLSLHPTSTTALNGSALRCRPTAGAHPHVTLRGLYVIGAFGPGAGVDADGCDVTLLQSTILISFDSGLRIQQGSFTVINNIISINAEIEGGSAVILDGLPASRFEHNTVARNGTTINSPPPAVDCQGGLLLRNNVIYGNGNAQAQVTGDCSYEYSLIGPQAQPGEGNITTAPDFVDPGDSNLHNDYHLKSGSAGIDVGLPTDVKVDFDGDSRPFGPKPDMGADEWKE